MAQTTKKRFTVLFEKVFLNPFLLILKAMNPAAFNCTKDVGIPFTTDAKIKRLATMNAMIVAFNGFTSTISSPLGFVTLCPNSELPMAKQGATINTDKMIIGRKFSVEVYPSSLAVNEAIGAAALATLLAPIENAT